MANTIARAQGFYKSGSLQNSEVTRLGSGYVKTVAATWNTFAYVVMNADGSGEFTLKRNGATIQTLSWGAET